MTAGAGERLLLGIAVELDASGVIRGVSLANQQLEQLDNRSDDSIHRARRRNQGIQQGLQMAGGAVTALGSGITVLGEVARRGVLQPMIREAEGFEVEFAQLRFVTDSSGEALDRLRQTAIETGLATQFSPAEAARAMRMLAAAGLETEAMYSALHPALDLATASAGQVDLSSAAQVTAAAIAKLSRDGWDARRIMDSFADATRATNLQFEDMRVIINGMGDFPQTFNATAGEVFALGGVLRNMGQLSGQAGQAMGILGRRLLTADVQLRRAAEAGRELSGRQLDIQRATERLNVRLFDSQGALRPMIEVFADMADGLATVTEDSERLRLQQVLLGPQAQAVLTAMGQYESGGLRGGDALRALINRLSEAEGVSREAAATFEDTAQGVRIFIQGTVQTILILLGETLGPALRVLMGLTRDVLGRFLEFIQANPMVAKTIGFIIVGFVALALVIGPLLIGLGGLLLFVAGLVPIVTAGAAALGTIAAVLGYVLIAVAALAAMFGSFFMWMIIWGAALYYAYEQNLGGLADFINDWVSDLRLLWQGLVDFFDSSDGSVSAVIIDQLEERGMLEGFLNILAFTRRIEEAWAGMKDVIVPTLEAVGAMFSWWLESLIWIFDTVEDGLAAIGFRFDENMSFWRTLGQVIGVVIIVLTVLTLLITGALAAAVILLGVLWVINMLPLILFVALIVGLVLLFVALVRSFRWLGGVIADFAVAVWEGLVSVWETVVEAVSSAWDSVADAVSSGVDAAWNYLVDLWDGIVEWGSGIVDSVVETFQEIWAPFAEFGRRVQVFWNRLVAADAPWRVRHWNPFYERYVEPVITAIEEGFNAFVEFFRGIWQDIVSAATTAWDILSEGARMVADFFAEVWETVSTTVVSAWNTVTETLSTAWTGIVTFFVGLGVSVANTFRNMWASIVTGFTAAFAWLSSFFAPVLEFIIGFGDSISTFFAGLWESITTTVQGWIAQAGNWGRDLIDTFLGGIRARWGNLVNWFSENIADVSDLLPSSDARTGPLSNLTQSGQSLVTTFMTGAQMAFPGLTGVVSQGMGGVMSALGLPSTTEGAANLVEGGVAGVVQTVAPIAELVGTGTGGGSRTVTVTIGDINVSVQQATPEEAERLAAIVLERLRTALEQEGEATFA